MANVTHSTITDPYIHETKGYESAEAGTVKMATGSGASTFNRPLELIKSWDGTYSSTTTLGTATDLEDYRSLFLVTELITTDASQFFFLRFSNNNGSSYHSTGYKTSYLDNNSDDLNIRTAGGIMGIIYSGWTSCYGITKISNFNTSADYTSATSNFTSVRFYDRTVTGNTGEVEPASTYVYYPTAEAHNAIQISAESSSSGKFIASLWGIRG